MGRYEGGGGARAKEKRGGLEAVEEKAQDVCEKEIGREKF
jgi:hypothetical protein